MKPSIKLAPEKIIFLATCAGAILIMFSAYYQLVQSKKSGEETKELLEKATLQISKTDALNESQRELILKATNQLLKTEEGLHKTESIIESQQKLIASQEETIKQITGGDGIPRLMVKVMDNYDAVSYNVKIGLINEDKYPILNVQASAMDNDQVFQNYSPLSHLQGDWPENSIKKDEKYAQMVTLSPRGAHLLLSTALKFSKPSQVYYVNVSWMRGRYDMIFRLLLKDYVPVVEMLSMTHNYLPMEESERQKYFLLTSDIFERAKEQKAEIESRINFSNSIVPIIRIP